jgi:hypothetical protein
MSAVSTSPASGSAWLKAGALLAVGAVMIAVLAGRVRPGAEAVAVIFPPWWDARQAIVATAAAGASIVRTGAIPAILIVQPADGDGLARLQQAGAWFALDPRAVAACFSNPKTTQSEGPRS